MFLLLHALAIFGICFIDEIGPVIGIDFGTTFSCVGVFNNGKVEIIQNEIGNSIIPSIVSFSGNNLLIGDYAMPQLILNPNNTIYSFKRLIGRHFNDPEVQREIKNLPYKIIDKNDRPYVEVTYKDEVKAFSLEEITSMLLANLKKMAENSLGKPIQHAVIAVPTSFDNEQRIAIADAATLAGLDTIIFLDESKAAAMAYQFDKADHQKILVLDFGGGTFDASLLSSNSDRFNVIASASDPNLGGEEFDSRVVTFLCEVFVWNTGRDASKNVFSMAKLKREAEKAKRSLSTLSKTLIDIENFFEDQAFYETLTRSRFEGISLVLFRKIIKTIDQVLKDSNVSSYEVDEIILVGGLSRIPKIQQLVNDHFNGILTPRLINPKEAVVQGAAMEGRILSDDPKSQDFKNCISDSLGIETADGIMKKIIPRNTRFPVKKTHIFVTSKDNQEYFCVKIYAGDHAFAYDNKLLGAFDLTGLPPAPKGKVRIKVTFKLDINGILLVTAESNDNKKSIIIDINKLHISEDDIEKGLISSRISAIEREAKMKAVLAKDKLEMMVYTAGLKLNENALNRKPNSDETKKLNDILYEFIEWIRSNEEEEEIIYEEKIIEWKQRFPKLQSEATVDDEKREDDDDFNEEEDI